MVYIFDLLIRSPPWRMNERVRARSQLYAQEIAAIPSPFWGERCLGFPSLRREAIELTLCDFLRDLQQWSIHEHVEQSKIIKHNSEKAGCKGVGWNGSIDDCTAFQSGVPIRQRFWLKGHIFPFLHRAVPRWPRR